MFDDHQVYHTMHKFERSGTLSGSPRNTEGNGERTEPGKTPVLLKAASAFLKIKIALLGQNSNPFASVYELMR